MQVGVLALQGAFQKHCHSLEQLDCQAKLVRHCEELFLCDALIIPGGESTVMQKLIDEANLREALHLFAKAHPILGTCAGLILLAQEKLLSVEVERNAYGRQIDSFATKLAIIKKTDVPALFIRAPKITKVLSPKVEILATYNNIPVLVKEGHILAASFHPELTKDLTIHKYFIEEVKHARSGKKRSLLCHR